MIKISTLIVVLGVMLLSAAVFATSADATGIVWRAVNKTGSSLFDIANVAFTNCSNGNVLQYQTSNSTWICAAPSGVTSINSQTGSSQTLTGTANNVTISSSSDAHTFNLGSNVVTTGGSAQTITKGLTINSGTLGGSLNANSQRITSLGTPTASTDGDRANTMGLLGSKVTSTCANSAFLRYQSSNSTWICATPSFQYNFLSAGIAAGVGSAWTNMPAAQTELYASASRRLTIDTATFNEARIQAGYTTIGFSTAIFGLQYSVDSGTTWKAPNNGTANKLGSSTVALGVTAAPASKTSTWMTLTSEAKATDVLWRITGEKGDGTADPAFTNISVQFR